jgi:hypothetical protein
VVPYCVNSAPTGPKIRNTQTAVKNVLELAGEKSKQEVAKKLDLFDGNIVANTATFKEAEKAFNAIAVSNYNY